MKSVFGDGVRAHFARQRLVIGPMITNTRLQDCLISAKEVLATLFTRYDTAHNQNSGKPSSEDSLTQVLSLQPT